MITQQQIEALQEKCDALESAVFDILDILIQNKLAEHDEYQDFVASDAQNVKDSLENLLKYL